MKIAEWESSIIKCTRSLIFKVAALLAIGLFVVISIFSNANVRITEKRLLEIATNEASKTSNAIKGSLENAMVADEKTSVPFIIEAVSNNESVEDMKVLNIGGQIRYAKNKTEIDRVLDKTKIEGCNICHMAAMPMRDNLTVIFKKADGSRVLRNVNPIDNKKECFGCHDPGQKIIGKLLIDFSVKDADTMVRKNRNLLIGTAAASVLTAVFVCTAVLLVLVRPRLHRLTKKVKETSEGDYSTTVEVKGDDEIAILSSEFNNMVMSIKDRDERIKQQLNTHTTLYNICAILKRASSLREEINLILNALTVGLNIEQCTILHIAENGKVELKGFAGLTEEQADTVRLVIETMFELSMMPVSKEREEIEAVICEKDKIIGDEVFVAAGTGKAWEDFIIAPLSAGGRLIGAITVHKIKDREINDPEIKNTLSIIATAMSPQIYIGLCLDKTASMQESPFDAIISDIQRNIEKAGQYQGGLSLIVIRAENYEDVVKKIGVRKASDSIREALIVISSSIDKVHETTRIRQDSAIVLLPMVTGSDALDTMQKATEKYTGDIAWQFRAAYYPDDGATAEDILHKAVKDFS
jgi:HAMP domain-containing protein/GGDEF domain-containing protein